MTSGLQSPPSRFGSIVARASRRSSGVRTSWTVTEAAPVRVVSRRRLSLRACFAPLASRPIPASRPACVSDQDNDTRTRTVWKCLQVAPRRGTRQPPRRRRRDHQGARRGVTRGVGRPVQQPAVPHRHRRHPAPRTRDQLLRSTPVPTGGWSQRMEPPPIPERFTRVKPRAVGGGTVTVLPQIPTRNNGKG